MVITYTMALDLSMNVVSINCMARDFIHDAIRRLLAEGKDAPTLEGVKIGYARVSTDDQNLDLQIDALTKDGVDPSRIFSDKMSGAKKLRPGLEEALMSTRRGDTLVVWKLDRLGRKLLDVLNRIEDMDRRGIGLRSLTETIDTTTPAGRLLMHMIAVFAEFERALTVERTRAGMRAKAARGGELGRPRKIDLDVVDKLLSEGRTISEAARQIGYTRAAVARYRTLEDAQRLARKNRPKVKPKPAPKRRQ